MNQLDQHHQTALMWAASEGHLATVTGLAKKVRVSGLGFFWGALLLWFRVDGVWGFKVQGFMALGLGACLKGQGT